MGLTDRFQAARVGWGSYLETNGNEPTEIAESVGQRRRVGNVTAHTWAFLALILVRGVSLGTLFGLM